MKKVIFTRDDGCVSIMGLAEGARLANSVILLDGTTHSADPAPSSVDTIFRGWPIVGATADWAETEDEFMARIVFKDVPVTLIAPPVGVPRMLRRSDALKGGFTFMETPYAIIEAAAIPVDRTFRDAWEESGATIAVNMTKAKVIHREHLRVLRAPVLERLDVEYLRADETGDLIKKADIALRKQALLDITADPAIDAATTPEILKIVIPSALQNEMID